MHKKIKMTVYILVVLLFVAAATGCSKPKGNVSAGSAGETIQTTAAAEPEADTTVQPEPQADAANKLLPNEQNLEAADADYLKVYFGVELTEDSLNAETFSQGLKLVAGAEAPVITGELNWNAAVAAAVTAADFEELMLSYPAEKVRQRLAFYGLAMKEDQTAAAALATALDTGLIEIKAAQAVVKETSFTVADAERLLMAIADANGDARNYLGMSGDPDIYGKVDQMWNSFLLFDDPELSKIGRQAVQQEISTGYGIKSAAYDARFLPDLTLQYGHSDIKHAHQLLGLLSSENIAARVQLEPKISIYQYLLEWGPLPEATPTYEVKQFDDLYLVYAVEYDLQLEFNNTEDMMRFDQVILDFAKKNEGNEEGIGLIYSSWWQPLYSTVKADMPEAYQPIFDCVVQSGNYSIHPFAAPERKDEVVEALTAMAGDGLTVTPVERFCNQAFYNYLSGADFQ